MKEIRENITLHEFRNVREVLVDKKRKVIAIATTTEEIYFRIPERREVIIQELKREERWNRVITTAIDPKLYRLTNEVENVKISCADGKRIYISILF